MTGCRPYDSIKTAPTIIRVIVQKQLPAIPDKVTTIDTVKTLLFLCWSPIPASRLSIDGCISLLFQAPEFTKLRGAVNEAATGSDDNGSRSRSLATAKLPLPYVVPDAPVDDELNPIGEGLGSIEGGCKPNIFECPGCDLTFVQLSALKQVR